MIEAAVFEFPSDVPIGSVQIEGSDDHPPRFVPSRESRQITLKDWSLAHTGWVYTSASGVLGRDVSFPVKEALATRSTDDCQPPAKGVHSLQRQSFKRAIFAVEHLYLRPANSQWHSLERFGEAALISKCLITYWTKQERHDDPEAGFYLALSRRVHWLSMHGVRRSIEHAWQAFRESNEGAGLSHEAALQRLNDWVKKGEFSWLQDWISSGSFRERYLLALRDWQAVCVDDGAKRVFIDGLRPWLEPTHDDWQRLREDELNQTVWPDQAVPYFRSDHQDRSPRHIPTDEWWAAMSAQERIGAVRVSTVEERAALRHVINAWYLPRYDLSRAKAIHQAITRAERDSSRADSWLRCVMPKVDTYIFGSERFLAAILAGYFFAAFTPDTWDMLYTMIQRVQIGRLVMLVGVLLFFQLWYLVRGIKFRIGIRSWALARERSLSLWGRGQLAALMLGCLLAFIVGPAQMAIDPHMGRLHPCEWIVVIVIYAQIAITFGIILQLLFDDKPATAPLGSP